MKIINQSFEIYKEPRFFTEKELIQKISLQSRICYKSENKSVDDETKFIKSLLKRGHNSCFEMGCICLKVNYCSGTIPYMPFLNMSIVEQEDYNLIISGSIRAFREVLIYYDSLKNSILESIYLKLMTQYPLFFNDIYYRKLTRDIFKIDFVDSNEFINMIDIYKNHTYQSVKFITNRAVSHELVRHRTNSILQESQRYCSYDKDQFNNEVTFIKPTAFSYLMEDENYIDWKETMEFCEKKYLKLLKKGISPQSSRTVLPNSCKTEIIIYANLRQWEHIFKMRAINPAAEPSMKEAMIPVYEQFKILYPRLFDNPQVKICN